MPRHFFGKRQRPIRQSLTVGLSVRELIDYIESFPDKEKTSQQQNWLKWDDANKDLIACGESAVEPIIQRLLPNPSKQSVAIRALGNIGDQRAADPLWKIFYSSENNQDIQIEALHTLSKLKDERVFDVAVSLLDHENIYIRRTAVLALGSLVDTRATEILIRLLQLPNEPIATAVVTALGLLKDQRALAPLTERISNAEAEEIALLINTFASIGGVESVLALDTILHRDIPSTIKEGEYGHLRCRAVDAIAQIDQPEAVIVLRNCLHHAKRGVRRHARRALKKL